MIGTVNWALNYKKVLCVKKNPNIAGVDGIERLVPSITKAIRSD